MAKGHKHKVAVITGGANGIGQAFAKRLAEDGVHIAIADMADGHETVTLVEAAGRTALAVKCDVANPDSVAAMAKAVQDKFGRDQEAHIKERRGSSHSRYEPFLLASQFTQLDGLSVTIRQTLTSDDLIGRAFSMSTCSREKLGPRAQEFADALTAALRELSPDGTFAEVAELVALLARRPQ